MKNEHKLTNSQKSALEYMNKYSNKLVKQARNDINGILYNSNNTIEDYNCAIENLRNKARVGVQFHPDRPDSSLKTTIENLFEQGIYKNQFETLISSGGASAFKGGDRDKWEKDLFGRAYNGRFTKNSERPKYGSLDLLQFPDGPSPRFGSCYFLLKPNVSHRCTFTYLDSHQKPKERGTLEVFDLIMNGLLRDTFHYDNTLGQHDITIKQLLYHLSNAIEKPMEDISKKETKRTLNNYIEAQIHGVISLQNDVEIMVADPSFRETDIGDKITKTCRKYSIELLWHMGFALKLDEVPNDFRGKEMPKLAAFITKNGFIDTHHLGLAAIDQQLNPNKWKPWGSQREITQKIKLLWHVLVKYGKKYEEIIG
jgi:hypothetical protein